MRLLSSRVGVLATAIVLATGGVSGLEVCYPSCVSYASTTLNQLTPWNDNILLPKFDSGDGRVLTKVTIKTKIYVQTEIFMKCTGDSKFCDESFTGTTEAGVEIGMRPASSGPSSSAALNTNLPQYWGRWGGYRPADPTSQYDAADRVGKDDSDVNFFVEYTYPFFDIPQYTAPAPLAEGTDPYGVWSYVAPVAGKQSRIFYAKDGTYASDDGRIVIYSNIDPGFGDSTYSTTDYNPPANTLATVKYGVGGTPTPSGTEVPIGTLVYDGTGTDFIQTISLDDYAGAAGGGESNTITPEFMLDLFSDPTGTEDIAWDADATGFISVALTGGNYQARQETKGHALMQIRYEYTGNAITQQDPQFSGFQGQSFQVHGYPGSYFHLMSAPQFQMNGRFAYLANGHCNYKHTPCWTHPGTYIDDIAIVVDELLVRITAGPVGTGYSVRINDEPFHSHSHHNASDSNSMNHTDVREFVPTKFYDAATRLTVHLRSPLEVVVRTDLFSFTIHNADHFFNIDSQLLVRPILIMGREASAKYPHPQNGKPWFPQFPIHGFVGQTWAKATYPHNKQYQGDVDDYVETHPYATESSYSQYFKKFDDKNMNWEN